MFLQKVNIIRDFREDILQHEKIFWPRNLFDKHELRPVELLDKGNNKVLNVEKIFIGKRLRHFGVKESGDIFLSNENYFYITADRDGLYKVKFDKFR